MIRSEATGASATVLILGADRGIPTLDAGAAGRAVPEVRQSVCYLSVDTGRQRYGVYQIGDVYARSWCVIGMPSGNTAPSRTLS